MVYTEVAYLGIKFFIVVSIYALIKSIQNIVIIYLHLNNFFPFKKLGKMKGKNIDPHSTVTVFTKSNDLIKNDTYK